MIKISTQEIDRNIRDSLNFTGVWKEHSPRKNLLSWGLLPSEYLTHI